MSTHRTSESLHFVWLKGRWGWWHDASRAVQIMKEDRAMIEALLPQQMGDKQLNVRSDLPQMRYYKLRDLHLDMGDGVDPENANRI